MLGSSHRHGSPGNTSEQACGLLADMLGIMSHDLYIVRLGHTSGIAMNVDQDKIINVLKTHKKHKDFYEIKKN